MRKNILIGTTAINRPELHSDVMPDWINWICKLDSDKYNIRWFMNIDVVPKLEPTFEETKDNFEKLVNDRINVTYLKNKYGKGNFLFACKRIAQSIMIYYNTLSNKADTRVIWLEDDWKMNPSVAIDINTLLDTYSTNLSHINMTFIRNNYIWALAPSIMGFDLWKDLHHDGWMAQKDMVDPEHCIGLWYIRKYGKQRNVTNLTIMDRKIDKKYLDRDFVKYNGSKFTFSDDKYIIGADDDRYIKREDIKKYYKDKRVFMRITPTFCIGGCNYGRDFMEKHGLYKSHKQSNEHKDFYGEKQ